MAIRWIVAFTALAATIVGVGLILVHLLLPAGLGAVDERIARWFVLQRTPSLDAATRVASALASTEAIVVVALGASIAFALRHRWEAVAFLVFALSLEAAVLLTTTFLVNRERPLVPRLDATPATASYPSGHAAASLVLYGGLALIVWSSTMRRAVRWLAPLVAAMLVAGVGVSRLYRGMHHLTDVLAGLVLGCGALWAAWLSVRPSGSDISTRTRSGPGPRGPGSDDSGAQGRVPSA